eukprot:s1062_g14.t1
MLRRKVSSNACNAMRVSVCAMHVNLYECGSSPRAGRTGSEHAQLFQSEEAKDDGSEALRPDAEIGGENSTEPLYVSFPDAEMATVSQVSEWHNVTGVLSGWGRQFGARRGLFHNAAQAETNVLSTWAMVTSSSTYGSSQKGSSKHLMLFWLSVQRCLATIP